MKHYSAGIGEAYPLQIDIKRNIIVPPAQWLAEINWIMKFGRFFFCANCVYGYIISNGLVKYLD